MLASCHIAAPDVAIDRSFVTAGLAARALEEFLSHRPARAPSPGDPEPKTGRQSFGERRDGSAGRNGTEWKSRNGSGGADRKSVV